MSEFEQMASVPKTTPSLLAANTFLLLGTGIIIGVGGYLKDLLPPYWMGILAEFALAALALGFMRSEKLSITQTLRLHWPGWTTVALSALLAVGIWIMSISINIAATLILGYSAPTSPAVFPKNIGGALALLIATIIAAPVCEEIMFRGYVQRAYERWGAWAGILISGSLFALYHLRFQGLFALIPVSLLLGFVAWRSHSLWPGIVLHAVHNSIASILIIATSFFSVQVVGLTIMMVICVAFLMVPLALVAAWLFWQDTVSPPRSRPQRMRGWRRWLWALPVALLLVIYGYAAFVEILVGRFPEVLAATELILSPAPSWDAPQQWTYTIHDHLNETIGAATCTLTPQITTYTLQCHAEHSASETSSPLDILPLKQLLNLNNESRTWTQRTVWADKGLYVEALTSTQETTTGQSTLSLDENGVLILTNAQNETTIRPAPANALLADEWPWRLSQIPFALGYGVTLPYIWIDETGQMQSSEAYLGVVGGEPVWTPAENFVAWKVTLTYEPIFGEEVVLTAWYDENAPHTLLSYNDGQVTYVLSNNQ